MHLFARIGMTLLLLVSLLSPAMTCALPGSQMTRAEHACCGQMKGKCGGMKMPRSHSCCQQIAQISFYATAVQPKPGALPVPISAPVVLPSSMPAEAVGVLHHAPVELNASPPYSSPRASVLRI